MAAASQLYFLVSRRPRRSSLTRSSRTRGRPVRWRPNGPRRSICSEMLAEDRRLRGRGGHHGIRPIGERTIVATGPPRPRGARWSEYPAYGHPSGGFRAQGGRVRSFEASSRIPSTRWMMRDFDARWLGMLRMSPQSTRPHWTCRGSARVGGRAWSSPLGHSPAARWSATPSGSMTSFTPLGRLVGRRMALPQRLNVAPGSDPQCLRNTPNSYVQRSPMMSAYTRRPTWPSTAHSPRCLRYPAEPSGRVAPMSTA